MRSQPTAAAHGAQPPNTAVYRGNHGIVLALREPGSASASGCDALNSGVFREHELVEMSMCAIARGGGSRLKKRHEGQDNMKKGGGNGCGMTGYQL